MSCLILVSYIKIIIIIVSVYVGIVVEGNMCVSLWSPNSGRWAKKMKLIIKFVLITNSVIFFLHSAAAIGENRLALGHCLCVCLVCACACGSLMIRPFDAHTHTLKGGNNCMIVGCVSRVAQWKRVGPITQRSVDRNYPLLPVFFQS